MVKYTILGGKSFKEKQTLIKSRLKEGWLCKRNRRTGVFHIWIKPINITNLFQKRCLTIG